MVGAVASEEEKRLPADLGERRTLIMRTALGELDLGVKEDPPGSNRGERIDLYMPEWVRGGSWCAGFVCWVLKESLGEVPTGRFRAGVHALKKDAEEVGLWRGKGEYLPSPGDVFIMDMGRGTGHCGFVLGVGVSSFETVEGNSGDRIRAGIRNYSDSRIIGFIETVPQERYVACWSAGIGEDNSAEGTR